MGEGGSPLSFFPCHSKRDNSSEREQRGPASEGIRLAEIQLLEVTQLGLRTDSRGHRSSISFVPSLGQACGMLRAQGEGGVGGGPSSPSFPCPVVVQARCCGSCVRVCFLRPSRAPRQGPGHPAWRQPHSQQAEGLSAPQSGSRLAAGMTLGPPGSDSSLGSWQHGVLQQMGRGQPRALREQGSSLGRPPSCAGLTRASLCRGGSAGCRPGPSASLP